MLRTHSAWKPASTRTLHHDGLAYVRAATTIAPFTRRPSSRLSAGPFVSSFRFPLALLTNGRPSGTSKAQSAPAGEPGPRSQEQAMQTRFRLIRRNNRADDFTSSIPLRAKEKASKQAASSKLRRSCKPKNEAHQSPARAVENCGRGNASQG